MNGRMIKSIASLVAVIALGAGVTYAQLTSNVATIGTSAMTSGQAHLKLCNDMGDDMWKQTISPALSLSDLVPGDDRRELTAGSLIYAGNDDNQLTDNLTSVGCNGYGPAEPVGSSDVPLKLVPKVTIDGGTCDLQNDMRLTFKVGATESTEKTLQAWVDNATTYGDVMLPDGHAAIQIFGRLDSDVSAQNLTCTFGVTFEGKQVDAP